MTNVYLIKKYGGEWEDKYETLISAHFDEEIAYTKMNNLNYELKLKREKLNEMKEMYDSCDCMERNEICESCEEYEDLTDDIIYREIKGYTIEKIEVE